MPQPSKGGMLSALRNTQLEWIKDLFSSLLHLHMATSISAKYRMEPRAMCRFASECYMKKGLITVAGLMLLKFHFVKTEVTEVNKDVGTCHFR
jgi:hypothetical protein